MRVIRKTNLKKTLIAAPPAKAYTLRAILFSALAEGTSSIHNPLLGADQLALIEALNAMGASIERGDAALTIRGCGGRFRPNCESLFLNESGVAMNFLIAGTCLADKPVILTGKEGLLKRPVAPIVEGVRQLGGQINFLDQEGFPPVCNAAKPLTGGTAVMSGAKSSQYFSSLASFACYAENPVTIVCSDTMAETPYFEINCAMMREFGVQVFHDQYKRITVPIGQKYQSRNFTVEGDFSSASYFFQAAAVCGMQTRITGLNPASIQGDRKIVAYVQAMGCTVESDTDSFVVTPPEKLKPIDTDMGDTPDIVPTVAAAACFADGISVLRNIGHLRYKECDRLTAIAANLHAMGIHTEQTEDSLTIHGDPSCIHGAVIQTFSDHRIAMAFAVAGLAAGGLTIDDPQCVQKSFPDFWERFSILENTCS